jgi:MFS family permease
MLAVPVLTSLTDRIDARRIYFFATLLAAVGTAGFGWLADGVVTAVLFQAIAGMGLAGTYMPGLRILSDRIDTRRHSRYVAFYTSSFGIGTSLSILLAGWIAETSGWRDAFVLLGIGPLLAGALVLLGTDARRPEPAPGGPGPLLDLRGVFRNRAARSYIVAYAAHCWELFGLRSWMVAFLAFSASLHAATERPFLSAAAAAAAINLLGPLASIFGNELAATYGRRRTVARIMWGSAIVAAAIGFTAPLPWLIVFLLMVAYFLLVMGESAALTAGLIGVAAPGRRGATMAVHSFLGFGAGFAAPLAFGIMLDLFGGGDRTLAWGMAFVILGAGAAIGPIAFAVYERSARQRHARGSRSVAGPGRVRQTGSNAKR